MPAEDQQAPRRKSKKVYIIWSIIGVILIYIFVAPLVQRAILRAQLNTETAKAFDEAHLSIDRQHSQYVEAVKKHTEVSDSVVYSAAYDICYTDHSDSGWVVSSYHRKCLMSSITLFEVDDIDENHELLQRFTGDYSVRTAIKHDVSNVRDVIDRRLLTSTVVTYAGQDAFDARRLVTEAGVHELDSQKTYLALSSQKEYFNRNIGCAFGRLMFCSSPLGE